MNIADTLNTLVTNVAALQKSVDALPTTAGGVAVDLTPVTMAIASVQATANSILTDLTPTVAGTATNT